MPKALPAASTTRRGINPSKFMGASFAAGSTLEKKVDNNSRKITLLKNIIKVRKENVDNKLDTGSSLEQGIRNIASTVTSISETLKARHKFEVDQAKEQAISDEGSKRNIKEGLLKNSFKGVTTVAEKVLAPVKNLFDRIIGFIGKLLLGKVAVSLFDWLSDGENQGKVTSIVRFFKDWWPVMLAGYLAFGTSFIPFTAVLIAGLKGFVAMLTATVIPGLLSALKILGPWGLAAVATVGLSLAAIGLSKGKKEEDTEVVERNQGGLIPGRGPNKDSVATMLTPGEFVMSRDAVDTWGVNTLAGMNAAAGGKNTGSPSRGFNEGGQVSDANLNKKGYSDKGAQWWNTGKEGYYGSDRKENRFVVGKESFFLQIPKDDTDRIEIWNEEFGSDRWVGNLDRKSKTMTYAGGWLRNWTGKGARDEEKEAFDKSSTKQMILRRADDLIAGKVTVDQHSFDAKAARASGKQVSLGPNTPAKFMTDLSDQQRKAGFNALFNRGAMGGEKIPDIDPTKYMSSEKMKVLGIVV